MRVVLDTNILVSAILSPRGAAGAVLRATQDGHCESVTSPTLLAEVEEVLGRFMSSVRAAEARAAFEELAQVVEPAIVAPVSRDPDDDHVLAAAGEGACDVVVRRDRDLLALDSWRGIRIVEPAAFLAVLG